MHLIVKKKVTLIVLLATCIILGYLSFIAWSVGFLLSKYLGSNTVGEPSKIRSYIIPLGRYKIHLHHWLLSSCAIVGFVVFKGSYVLPSNVVYGFLGAIVFHGIYFYSDWHKVLIPRHVQSLAGAKHLVAERITFVTHLLELKQEIEEAQTSLRIYPPPLHCTSSLIGHSGSMQDEGSYKKGG